MNEHNDLISQMRHLASALPREASVQVEERLLRAFRARQRRKRQRWIYMVAAAAACVILIASLRTLRPPAVVADTVYEAPAFIPLPYAQSGVPMESAVVIRVQMRSSELTSMGVAVPAEPSISTVKADLLIGQDGVPRAVRFVR